VKQKQIGPYLCDQSLGKFVIRFQDEHRGTLYFVDRASCNGS
jgi:hypothetical protein